MSNTVLYAVCAAIALAVGAGLGALFAVRSRAPARWLAPAILAVVALALNHLVLAPALARASRGASGGGAAEKLVRALREEARRRPALEDFLRAQESAAKTGEQTFVEAAELAARGVSRLDPAQLVRRAKLVDAALPKVDERTCARLGLEGSSPAVVQGLVPTFGDSELREWAALFAVAMERELAKAPVRPPLSAEQVAALMAELQARDPEVGALAAKAQASDADRCAFTRRLYAQVRSLTGKQLLDLALFLRAAPT